MNEMAEMISQLVSNVGFPIACVAVMFWQNWETQKLHREEAAKWAETLERNTVVLEKNLEVSEQILALVVKEA